MLTKTKVIVLHRFPYSDSSFIVKALSREMGVLSFLVKGGKKKESAFKGSLDPLAESEVVFNAAQKSELLFLREATLLEWHAPLRSNLEATAEAQVMVEVLLKFAPQGMPLESEFDSLEKALANLDLQQTNLSSSVSHLPSSHLARFLFELSDSFGFTMDLENCGECGAKLNGPPVDFREDTGDMLCRNCCFTVATGRRAEYLSDLQKVSRGQIPENASQTEAGILHYLRLHLGMQQKTLNSIAWLQEVRKICSQQNKS